MILLDTNALIWLAAGRPRARPLERMTNLRVSPASVLELALLAETGRVKIRGSIDDLLDDPHWEIDEPPPLAWFNEATALSWTRDPFDRMIVGHALERGWRLATADSVILDHLTPKQVLEL